MSVDLHDPGPNCRCDYCRDNKIGSYGEVNWNVGREKPIHWHKPYEICYSDCPPLTEEEKNMPHVGDLRSLEKGIVETWTGEDWVQVATEPYKSQYDKGYQRGWADAMAKMDEIIAQAKADLL